MRARVDSFQAKGIGLTTTNAWSQKKKRKNTPKDSVNLKKIIKPLNRAILNQKQLANKLNSDTF